MPQLKAIFFDQDGVIVDTERDGHRVAFNQTFAEFGLPISWDVPYYHELLQVSGGKERMRKDFDTRGFGRPIDDVDGLIKQMHHRKTDVFVELIEGGCLPLRPGIHRLMREAQEQGVLLCVCTTSNERAAHAITSRLLGDIRFHSILAGDVVKAKKPDPAVYLLALERTGVRPQECVVVEDSRNGTLAGRAAGCRVLATVNEYTRGEDMSAADAVVTSLGEPGEPAELLAGPAGFPFQGYVDISALRTLMA